MITLIRPPAVECFRLATSSTTVPLGLAYIAGALRSDGHDVQVIDAVGAAPKTITRYYKGYLVGLKFDEIIARIPGDADWIGITVIFTHEWPAVVKLIEGIKSKHPHMTVVLGGEHITSMPEFCLLTSKADFLVLGEGEETVVALASAFKSGRDLSEIEGIAYQDGGRIVVNKRRQRQSDVDSIPLPAWELFDLETYHRHRYVGGMYSSALTIPILATRGCPYQCTYYSAPNMWLPRWIPRSPRNVVDEIEYYVREYGAGNFPFQDLTAIIRKDWIVEFCQELLHRGLNINWQLPTGTRSEAIDDEVAELLKKSGMITMAYAPESGSDETRQLIKKKMTLDRLFASIRAAVNAGHNVAAFLVIGFPHDTKDHVLENMPFITQLVEEGVTDVNVGFFMALPGTELFYSLYDAGKITIDREYFRHILHNTALWPATTYCENLTRWQLTVLKLKMVFRFYGAKRNASDRFPLFTSILRAISGFRSGDHQSRLQTVFRNAVTSIWDSFKVRFKKGWMSPSEERDLFQDWDAIYRRIRRHKIQEGIVTKVSADSSELHRSNIIPLLKQEHDAVQTLELVSLERGRTRRDESSISI